MIPLLSGAIDRREFLAILGISAALDFAAYRPKAFSAAEYELLDGLAESLLPADETGPGAHAAHVAYYVDVVLSHAPDARLQFWKGGLVGIEAMVHDRFQQSFAKCSDSQKQALLAELAKNELAPLNESDKFFVDFKRTVIDGFYASELIQREHLGYKGNTAVHDFVGCPHPNFEHPDR